MVTKPSIRKFECSSCKYADYRFSSMEIGETIPGDCPRCGGNLKVTAKDLPPSLERPLNLVLRSFDVSDMVALPDRMEFEAKSPNPKRSFRSLFQSLKKIGYLPVMRKQEDELKLLVMKQAVIRPSRNEINLALFVATVCSTFAAWYFFFDNSFFNAALFSTSLMLMLGSHELGHWLAARRSGVASTLPYFIPSPFFLGTFGAIIRVKSPIPTKEALVEMGAAGPLVGFILSVIVTYLGMTLVIPTSLILTFPFMPGLFSLIQLMTKGIISSTMIVNPLIFAGWVMMFLTMFNLLPAGGLDGGHIARSLMDRQRHQFFTQLLGFLLVFVGILFPDYPFWVWGFLIILIFRFPHPGALDDVSPLAKRQKILAFVALLTFLLCIPLPLG